MSAAEILIHLQADGLTLHTDGERLLAAPRTLITDDHRHLIRTHKPALLALLTAANDARHRAPQPTVRPFKRYRVTVEQDGEHRTLTMLSPAGRSAEQAEAAAYFHFGERLLAISEVQS